MTPSYDPYYHLDPGVWKATKSAHITLTVMGTLLLAPALLVLAVFWESIESSYSMFRGIEGFLMLGSAMIGTISGGIAWLALCLLYFKRSDLRWQRLAWSSCSVFGFITTPCITGWIIWILAEEPGVGGFMIIPLGILITSIACIILGMQNARLASRSLDRKSRCPEWPVHPSGHYLLPAGFFTIADSNGEAPKISLDTAPKNR